MDQKQSVQGSGIDIKFDAPDFYHSKEYGIEWLRGSFSLPAGSKKSGLIELLISHAPEEMLQRPWAIFNAEHEQGVIIQRMQGNMYAVVSTYQFNLDEPLSAQKDRVWHACPLIRSKGIIPGTIYGEWYMEEKMFIYSNSLTLHCEECWLILKASWSYEDIGTGNRYGWCHANYSGIFPSGAFTDREHALRFLSCIPDYGWGRGKVYRSMEGKGFLL